MAQEQAFSAQNFAWVISEGNDRRAQLESGGAYVRLNLRSTELGLARSS
jgi:hypothetical protein